MALAVIFEYVSAGENNFGYHVFSPGQGSKRHARASALGAAGDFERSPSPIHHS